jgi:hypothetical protein
MARKGIKDLDLTTLKGRLAFAIKTTGPNLVIEKTSLSPSQVNRLSTETGGTTLEAAAEIAIATGFELKWIALGTGPQKIDDELWQETDQHLKITPLDPTQKITLKFSPELITNELNTTHENCLVWKIDYKINLDKLEKNSVVLIDKTETTGSGLFVVELGGKYQVAFIHLNMDKSANIKTDDSKPETNQTLTADNMAGVNIMGKIVFHAGHI